MEVSKICVVVLGLTAVLGIVNEVEVFSMVIVFVGGALSFFAFALEIGDMVFDTIFGYLEEDFMYIKSIIEKHEQNLLITPSS
jgi:hypothetical protein